jgi:ATP-dependent Clp protease adaptor protein ClpS
MSDQDKPVPQPPAGAATKSKKKPKQAPQKQPPKHLPQWKVLLHNDDVNTHQHVVKSIVELTHLSEQDATLRTEEADKTGVALLLVTHKERAELYRDQFQSKSLTVTIEPAE